jgi:hypothetical protein
LIGTSSITDTPLSTTSNFLSIGQSIKVNNLGTLDLDCGVTTASTCTFAFATVVPTVQTSGYAIGSLPTGVAGMRAYVTDQLTTCAASGAALTAGGSAKCPAFYNGTSWVGD